MNTRPDPYDFPLQNANPAPRPAARLRRSGRSQAPLGQILVDIGELDPGNLLRATAMRDREDVRLGTILLANGLVSERGLYRALGMQFDCDVADLAATPPDPRLTDLFGPDFPLQTGLLPWRYIGARLVIVTAAPEEFRAALDRLPPELNGSLMAIAPQADIDAALVRQQRQTLTVRAETRVDAVQSCRDWNPRAAERFLLAIVFLVLAAAVSFPLATLALLCSAALLAMGLNTGLKLLAALAVWRTNRRPSLSFSSSRAANTNMRLPVVSILVPLLRETAIAPRLIRRLSRLNYPRELLDICLVVEETDTQTQDCLRTATLPHYMRQIQVPRGTLHTKPRALNFALDFCRGTIVGVLDAEDAPEPDQVHRVVRHFHRAPAQVACLQGILDFYNARTNWLSRCFTIEYAAWFRVVLPGLERLGLPLPLGGTTLYFRKDALVELGAWDAHNVTEDADLGIRLARRGYRTELIPTITLEEANCRWWPWIRQRSRWLKGYAMTYAVHMRSPRQLYRDFGFRRFVGFQVFFLGTILHFVLSPFLWTFWAVPLGLGHPLIDGMGQTAVLAMTTLFLSAEVINLGIGTYATRIPSHRWLWVWIPTMHAYFPLATIAAIRACWETAQRPFFWDKTDHGHLASRRVIPARRRVSVASRTPG